MDDFEQRALRRTPHGGAGCVLRAEGVAAVLLEEEGERLGRLEKEEERGRYEERGKSTSVPTSAGCGALVHVHAWAVQHARAAPHSDTHSHSLQNAGLHVHRLPWYFLLAKYIRGGGSDGGMAGGDGATGARANAGLNSLVDFPERNPPPLPPARN
ncbi:hypothetical protein CVT25_006887 [Psilocybe cyanescens]|uniref:Uncharacterized protein n=1 Tax=Psilocybe cyanescens TaxID=93625 RepID=A0A409X668_PSICY|nr:hypothetical protein CVT25_006887 [Psilocybe cyanescens]